MQHRRREKLGSDPASSPRTATAKYNRNPGSSPPRAATAKYPSRGSAVARASSAPGVPHAPPKPGTDVARRSPETPGGGGDSLRQRQHAALSALHPPSADLSSSLVISQEIRACQDLHQVGRGPGG